MAQAPNLQARDAVLRATVVIRGKDGKVKYEGPVVMPVTAADETVLKEIGNGGNSQHSGA